MPDTSNAVRIFVAMPGSAMGQSASWSDIPEIKRRLLQPIATQLAKKLQRIPELIIEKDKTSTGRIHSSMFAEAVEADVYIADLTGSNPNVYLELGVRWALKDRVTIPICQDLGEVKFNVSGNRVISYGPMPDELDQAINQVVLAAFEGLRDPSRIDSPVRDSVPYVSVKRAEFERLYNEIDRLKEQQAEDLVAAARQAPTRRAIELLRRAIEQNPASAQAHIELGIALRKEAKYDEAVDALRRALRLKPDIALGWRELGVALSKGKRLEEASKAFQRAVELDDSDSETWATLGGLRRRLAFRAAGSTFDWEMLRTARNAYEKASSLSGNDTYPLLNLARVDLLLTAVNAGKSDVLDHLRRLEHLARYAVEDASRRDPWKLLDLADTLLLTGRVDAGLAEVQQAIALITHEDRASYLSSVIQVWQGLIDSGVLDELTRDGLQGAIEACRVAISES